MIDLEPLVETVRFFRPGKEYGQPFDSVATIVIVGDFAVMVGMHGVMTEEFWREMQDKLKERGVADLLMFRHHRRCWYSADEFGQIHRSLGVRFPDPALAL